MHPHLSHSLYNWAGLNESLLETIFSIVCSPPRRPFQPPKGAPNGGSLGHHRHAAQLPAVCRHWRDVYERSSRLWRHVSVDLALVKHLTRQDELFDTILNWLCKRAVVVERLNLQGCHSVQVSSLEMLLKCFLARATSLCSLALTDIEGAADCLLQLLCQSAIGLMHLGLGWYQPAQGTAAPLCARLKSFENISSLKQLSSLSLKFDQITGLTPDHVSFIGSLPKVTYLELGGRKESLVLPPQVFLAEKSSALRELHVSNCRFSQFNPMIVEALSQLSYLSLDDVLAAKALRRNGTSLWESLGQLKGLRRMKLAQTPKDINVLQIAFSCTRLRALTVLRCSNVGPWPSIPFGKTAFNFHWSSLESLHLEEIGIQNPLPQSSFWSALPNLTELCWRAVKTAAPPHSRFGGGAGLAVGLPQDALERVVPQLHSLKLEYSAALDWSDTGFPELFALSGASNLTCLSLEGNFLGDDADFWVSMIKGLPIKKLNLANCNLCHIPREVYEISPLQELSLMNNPELLFTPEDEKRLNLIPKVWMNGRFT
jgi:Leucine-rich repeat (LRR) protein